MPFLRTDRCCSAVGTVHASLPYVSFSGVATMSCLAGASIWTSFACGVGLCVTVLPLAQPARSAARIAIVMRFMFSVLLPRGALAPDDQDVPSFGRVIGLRDALNIGGGDLVQVGNFVEEALPRVLDLRE